METSIPSGSHASCGGLATPGTFPSTRPSRNAGPECGQEPVSVQPDRAAENSPPIHRWASARAKDKSRQGRQNPFVPNGTNPSGTFHPPMNRWAILSRPNGLSGVLCSRTAALRVRRGFTLLELLVVISIIGLLAALATPVLRQFRPNFSASATRQLLDDLSRARQLAISQRTKVYMIFVVTNFWADPYYNQPFGFKANATSTNLFDKQLIGYALVSVGSLGDQPGAPTMRYLSDWRTLPQGAFIPYLKFALTNTAPFPFYTNNASGMPVLAYRIQPFPRSNQIPFPTEDYPPLNFKGVPYASVPYIAFDYMGRLLTGRDEIIPLASGNVSFTRDRSTRAFIATPPTINENPPGNSTNSTSYNLVCIDWLTGRARVQHQEVR